MRKYTILLLFTAPLLLAVSCKDKDKKNTSVCDVNPGNCQTISEAKDFFYFKVGSWWVYEEETSHVRDSMYVTEAAENPDGYEFDVRIKSALTDYEYHYWPEYYGNNGCSATLPVSKRCLLVSRSKYKPLVFLVESRVFFVRYFKNDFIYTGNAQICPDNKITIGEIYSNFSNGVLNFENTNTIRIDQNCDEAEGIQPTRIYYSKYGIVKKELIDSGQVWNLVNYHIEE